MKSSVSIHRHLLFWIVVCVTCGWDLYTKGSVFFELGYPAQADGEPVSVFGTGVTFRYFTTFNHGALWGMGQGFTWGFATLSFIAIGFILYWLFIRGHASASRWLTVSLGMIMGGTLGNLYDRMALHGARNEFGDLEYAVRDFLHFNLWGYDWPIFNYADVFLVSGAVMLAIYTLFLEEIEPATAEQPPQESEPKSAV
ncbi:MAG TPA: signal peptidase II [Planctomycetaceae bacterium]|nr:signal peptidase II [Planctomycetaceae bacterium]